jgi:hypothetical protein
LLARLGNLDVHDRLRSDDFCGRQVLFEQERRGREHIADVVESIADVVRRKIVGRSEVDSHEVANRVVVFGPVEPAKRHPADIGLAAIDGRENSFDAVGQAIDLIGRGTRPLLRRHLARADHVHHVFPQLAVPLQLFKLGELIERELGFVLLGRVAVETVRFEDRQNLVAEKAGRMCCVVWVAALAFSFDAGAVSSARR